MFRSICCDGSGHHEVFNFSLPGQTMHMIGIDGNLGPILYDRMISEGPRLRSLALRCSSPIHHRGDWMCEPGPWRSTQIGQSKPIEGVLVGQTGRETLSEVHTSSSGSEGSPQFWRCSGQSWRMLGSISSVYISSQHSSRMLVAG